MTPHAATATPIPSSSVIDNRRGIALMCVAMAAFVVNDNFTKLASQTLPAAQLIFLRGMLVCLALGIVALATGALPRPREWRRWCQGPGGREWRQRLVWERAGFDAVSTVLYLTGLFFLPLATAVAVTMAAPILMTMAAAVVLRERVGLRRWLIVLVGFAGVMLIIQPGAEGFNAFSLLCLLGTAGYACRDTWTRRMGNQVSATTLTLSSSLAVTALAGALSVFQGWRPLSWQAALWLVLAAGFLTAAYHLLVQSLRIGEVSVVAPFRYTSLLVAMVIGLVVWHEVPNTLAIVGALVLSGAAAWATRGR